MKKSFLSQINLLAPCVASLVFLAGCGGGGGGDAGSGPIATPSTLAFPLDAGYKARVANGANDNFAVSGSCTGTANISVAPAATSSFQGSMAQSTAHVSTVNATNCSPIPLSWTTYYNSNSVPIGISFSTGQYSVLKAGTQASALPASATISSTEGPFTTLTNYADNTLAVVTGQQVRTYLIEADPNPTTTPSTTAIANIITRTYDANGALQSTEQARHRMAENGTLTLISIDVQFSPPSPIHVLFTRQ